MLKKQ